MSRRESKLPAGVIGICPQSGKYQFRTRVDALICMSNIRSHDMWARGLRETNPSNVYRCPACKRWHLTSKSHRRRYQNGG